MQKKQNHLMPLASAMEHGTSLGKQKTKASLACWGILFSIVFLAACYGCRSSVVSAPPDKRSQYNVIDAEAGISMILLRDRDGLLGQGTIEGKEFLLTAVPQWRARGMITFSDGEARPITIEQSVDGSQMIVQGLGCLINLSVSTKASFKLSGPFNGEFDGGKALPIHLSLLQSGNLLSGIGRYGERPVSVTGRITAADHAIGYIVFPDESRKRVNAELGRGGEVLKVVGLGDPVKLSRVH